MSSGANVRSQQRSGLYSEAVQNLQLFCRSFADHLQVWWSIPALQQRHLIVSGGYAMGCEVSSQPIYIAHGSLAQLVEQRTFNPLVACSSHARPTICLWPILGRPSSLPAAWDKAALAGRVGVKPSAGDGACGSRRSQRLAPQVARLVKAASPRLQQCAGLPARWSLRVGQIRG